MRDVLTEEECRELIAPHLPGGVVSSQAMRIMFQSAARLGAERERERCAALCERLGTRAGTADECAEAIRRGEEG